jgi:hypothetical protein
MMWIVATRFVLCYGHGSGIHRCIEWHCTGSIGLRLLRR